MVQANKFIFPHPNNNNHSLQSYASIQNNIIYIPKALEMLPGCMCHTIVTHPNTLTSNLTTARTNQTDPPTQIIKIQSSRQLKTKMVKPSHRRTQTKLINLIAANHIQKHQKDNPLHPQPKSIKKHSNNDISAKKKITPPIPNHRPKFLSDELYREQSSEQSQNDPRHNIGRFIRQKQQIIKPSLTSLLWNYHRNLPDSHTIPCLYYQSSHHSKKIIVYFHGNGEDIAGCHNFLRNLSNYNRVSVLAVEYPGYSVYEGSASSEQIERDTIQVVEFLNGQVGFEFKDMMMVGRSIGTGPALHVASLFPIGGLVLLSPFLSLCEVVSDLYGKVASNLLKQRFDNKLRAQEVTCPSLIIHGTQDRLISPKHSTELSKYFAGYCLTKIIKNMSHSLFCHEQFYDYVANFQQSIQFLD